MLMPEMRAMPYPCRCLCRGFEQMTSTAPWRRMILHFSHMGLTEGRTFTLARFARSFLGGRGSVGAALEAAWASAIAPGTGRARRPRPAGARPRMVATGPCSGGGRFAPDLVPGREDPRTFGGHGHGELEVGGQGAVLGVDGPVVLAHPDGVAAGRGHGLDGQDHALLEQGTAAGGAVVGD